MKYQCMCSLLPTTIITSVQLRRSRGDGPQQYESKFALAAFVVNVKVLLASSTPGNPISERIAT